MKVTNKFQKNYCRALVITHGASEYQIASYIKRNLRIPLEIAGRDNGKHSIQINGLAAWLKKYYPTQSDFVDKYPNVEVEGKSIKDFVVFTVMDTDDCSPPMLLEKYKNKLLFNDHWMKKYICPIYNTPSLEHILFNVGIIDKMLSDNEKMRTYRKIFPLDKNNPIQTGLTEITTFRDKIGESKNTNFNKFIDYCIDWANANRIERQIF